MQTFRDVCRGRSWLGQASGERVERIRVSNALLHIGRGHPCGVWANMKEKIRAVGVLGDHSIVSPRWCHGFHLLVVWAVRYIRNGADDHGVCRPCVQITATRHVTNEHNASRQIENEITAEK